MKHLLPGKTELMIFLTMAVLCTGVVALTPKLDLGLAMLSVPVFIASAVMGLRRNWKLAEVTEEVPQTRSIVSQKEIA